MDRDDAEQRVRQARDEAPRFGSGPLLATFTVRHRRGLDERKVGRAADEQPLGAADVLGAGPRLLSEHLVTRPKVRHTGTHRLHDARHVDARDVALRLPPAGCRADDVWLAAQQVPVERVQGCGVDPHEDLSVGWDRGRRVHGLALHFDIIDNKFWIQYDGMDYPVVEELEAAGVPKEDIVLAFHEPEIRKLTGYAIG